MDTRNPNTSIQIQENHFIQECNLTGAVGGWSCLSELEVVGAGRVVASVG